MQVNPPLKIFIYYNKLISLRKNHHGMEFYNESQLEIRTLLRANIKAYPSRPVSARITFLQEHGYNVSAGYVRKIYSSWTTKKPERKHLLKYTTENLDYYGSFLYQVYFVPWNRLRYLDEASFVSRTLHSNNGPVGEKIFVYHNEPLNETYNVTLLTDLSGTADCITANMVNNTNDQYDFTKFIIYAIDNDILTSGDCLVLDGTAIHNAADTFRIVYDLCSTKGVLIRFLPAYSPELNPVELCWSQIKRYIRESRRIRGANKRPLWMDIIFGIAHITRTNIMNYYTKCIYNTVFNH